MLLHKRILGKLLFLGFMLVCLVEVTLKATLQIRHRMYGLTPSNWPDMVVDLDPASP